MQVAGVMTKKESRARGVPRGGATLNPETHARARTHTHECAHTRTQMERGRGVAPALGLTYRPLNRSMTSSTGRVMAAKLPVPDASQKQRAGRSEKRMRNARSSSARCCPRCQSLLSLSVRVVFLMYCWHSIVTASASFAAPSIWAHAHTHTRARARRGRKREREIHTEIHRNEHTNAE